MNNFRSTHRAVNLLGRHVIRSPEIPVKLEFFENISCLDGTVQDLRNRVDPGTEIRNLFATNSQSRKLQREVMLLWRKMRRSFKDIVSYRSVWSLHINKLVPRWGLNIANYKLDFQILGEINPATSTICSVANQFCVFGSSQKYAFVILLPSLSPQEGRFQ